MTAPTSIKSLVNTCHISLTCHILYSGKVWRIDSFGAFGERKFGEVIDQPIAIDY